MWHFLLPGEVLLLHSTSTASARSLSSHVLEQKNPTKPRDKEMSVDKILQHKGKKAKAKTWGCFSVK